LDSSDFKVLGAGVVSISKKWIKKGQTRKKPSKKFLQVPIPEFCIL
jgi:hypothetical protein